jgi:sortase family protein
MTRPTSVSPATVAAWLLVTALCLSIGAIGAGGVLDLISDDPVEQVAASAVAVPAGTGDPVDPGDSGTLDGTVVPPQRLPGGQALNGPAPSPRGVAKGSFTPFRPAAIRLPSGAAAPVQNAGVHADGALDVPKDPGRVGWWTGGAQAGDPYGSIVLAGHVDSRVYGIGVMAEMLRMRIGQTVTLTGADHVQAYRVVSKVKMAKASLAAGTDLFDQDVPHRLVMITCGGPFDLRTHRYRDNVVVIADPVTG